MKILSWLVGIVLTILLGLYVMIFTSFGNALVKPMVEKQIAIKSKLPTKLEKFSVGIDNFEIVMRLNPNNLVYLKGNYSLFKQSFNISYKIELHKLQTLQVVTQTKLNGSFMSVGDLKGDINFITIDGISNVAKSDTKYHIELTKFQATSIIATIKRLDLHSMLYLLNQKQYANGKIDLDINFRNIIPHKLDGDIKLKTLDGKLNTKVMKDDFNITIPKTYFNLDFTAKLKGDLVDYIGTFKSNLATLSSGGRVTPEPLNVNLTYNFDIKELALFKPISGTDIRGALNLNGKVTGTDKDMKISTNSDIGSSKTLLVASLKNLKPAKVQIRVRDLKIQKLLYMLKQPHYTDGLCDIDIKMDNLNMKHLAGTIDTKIKKGLLDSRYITKKYEFKTSMPRTYFKASTHTNIKDNLVDTKLKLNSNLITLSVKDAKFNLNDSSINSDYRFHIKKLSNFYFITQRELKGNFLANGIFTKAKDLDFSLHSNIADGSLNMKLHNDDVVLNIDSIQTLKLSEILVYPKVFKSKLNGDLNYNLQLQNGEFIGKLSDGIFTKNQILDLTKQYAHIDLYKELFKGDVKANINKEKILMKFDLISNKSSIKSDSTKLNTLTKQVHSLIKIDANSNAFSVKLDGDINSPKVKVDANELIKKEAQKAITKELGKHINKDSINKLLNHLF